MLSKSLGKYTKTQYHQRKEMTKMFDNEMKILFDLFIGIPSGAALFIGAVDFAVWKLKRTIKRKRGRYEL